ncbi:hypothetical protein E2F50_05135 [Rhizobium deserti]|uniref:Uncharacterized protein n=1 Tax=Rhizobium deserti TaxID=2547961 RepID=A0A4R5UNV7_9HYPH|nr:hypothetical protein [Rhizobium deserti]TDK39499.1 hypothetical protein E2F50_05135 [Rhizobium deserti]
MKIRLPKKFVLIIGGVLVLCGGSGAAAVFVGTDKILGPSYLEINGLECTALQTIQIKRDHRHWVRKYVVSDEPGDGMARIRTALRVARAVQEKEKADLVQVALLDKAGPTGRAEMRGRMIGAQVIYIPDLAKVPPGAAAQTYSAYYIDGSSTPKGEYYGMRIDLPLEDVEALSAKLTDKADCIDPVVEAPEGAHGATSGHGDTKKTKPKGGDHGASSGHGDASAHGEASGHGEPSAHGEAPAHGAAPAADAHAAAADAHGEEVAAKESGGFLSSITGMIFGSKDEAPAEGHKPEANATDGHAAEGHAAEGHAVKGEDHPAAAADAPAAHSAPAASHDATAADHPVASKDHPEAPVVSAASAPEKALAEPSNPDAGFFDSMKSMIFGGSEQPEASHDKASASASTGPAEPAPEPRTSAEGGKRWSSSTDADVIRSDEGATQTPHADGKPVASDGPTDADAAGAEWLAKFRAQQAAKP